MAANRGHTDRDRGPSRPLLTKFGMRVAQTRRAPTKDQPSQSTLSRSVRGRVDSRPVVLDRYARPTDTPSPAERLVASCDSGPKSVHLWYDMTRAAASRSQTTLLTVDQFPLHRLQFEYYRATKGRPLERRETLQYNNEQIIVGDAVGIARTQQIPNRQPYER